MVLWMYEVLGTELLNTGFSKVVQDLVGLLREQLP